MNAPRRAKTFKSGNSLAVRLPKELGVELGTEFEIVQDGESVSLRSLPRTIDLSGIYGSVPALKLLEPEDRLMEPRELDWEGKLLARD